MREFISESYADTLRIAGDFAKTLHKGAVVAYLGGLGMGKTAFTAGLARGLGLTCDVTSPTFALCNTYTNGSVTLHHFDMYRVETWDDLYSTGFFDFLDTDAYIAVEWSENIYAALPEDAQMVEMIQTGAHSRLIRIYEKQEDIKCF